MTVVAQALNRARERPSQQHRLNLPGRSRLRAAYEGTQRNRFTEDWVVTDAQPRELIAMHLSLLRQRSRDLARHAPHFVAGIDAVVDNVVGGGFRVTPLPHRDELGREVDEQLATRLAVLWRQWQREVDVDQRESFTVLLRTAVQELVETGEFFLVERPRPRRDRNRALPLLVEVIPSERLDHTLERVENPREPGIGGNRIVHGIEFDRDGQRVAYWFTRLGSFGELSAEQERVTADRVDHVFARRRAGQERGLPWLVGALMLCRDLDELLDAELTSAQVAACLTGWIQRQAAGLFPETQERSANDQRPVERFAPGMIFDLAPGESVTISDPNRPAGSFEPFAKFILHALAKTLGVSYETLSGDYRGVNFASGRLGHLVERRAYRRVQDLVIQLAIVPTWRRFVRTAVVSGAVEVDPLDYIQNWRGLTYADFGASGWEHHDPLKEATAAALRVLAGLSTLDDEASALGRDWQTIAEQRHREVERFRQLGLPLISVGGAQSITGEGDGNEGFETQQRRVTLGFSVRDADELREQLVGGGAD